MDSKIKVDQHTTSQLKVHLHSVFLLTVYHYDVQARSHIIQQVTHNASKTTATAQQQMSSRTRQSHCFHASGRIILGTHISPSKQISGPTTPAAPLLRRRAKRSGGQTLERPHFFGSGASVGGEMVITNCGSDVTLER